MRNGNIQGQNEEKKTHKRLGKRENKQDYRKKK